jgi:DNA-binding beta-propeller fold protein YncE
MNDMKTSIKIYLAGALFGLACFSACREGDDAAIPPTVTPVAPGEEGEVKGFFLLNEGNMGSNKASLDYFDQGSGEYSLNIFPTRNPGVVKGLGDVGNDLQIYGGKLYAVVNCSHLVEVMDAGTARHVATISIPNCRYIAFDGGHAYVSSYAGAVEVDPNARRGYVARLDTLSLAVTDTCAVGYQPEEMVVRDGKLYVANSGGYRVPDYDNTVSVVDLASFKETRRIVVGINLHRLRLDNHGNIYATSRGDYKGVHSTTYIIGPNDLVTKNLQLPASNVALRGDSLYVISAEWSNLTSRNTVSYAIVNTRTQSIVSRGFITDGTERGIAVPYGLAVHPATGDIYVTDAKDYVTPGTLYCFSPDGKKKWEVTTGDVPAHIAFTRKKLSDL